MSKKRKQIINLNDAKHEAESQSSSTISIVPRNTAQEEYITSLNNPQKRIVIATGPAGTGKTHLSVLHAMHALQCGKVDRIVITRPAVGVDGESHGFLPGTLNQKMEPWLLPIIDVFETHWSPQHVTRMIETKIIEIAHNY